jgi:RimJ/RimL family protein N-acetyltransferase
MKVAPVTLRGRTVRLEPLSIDHVESHCRVGLEPDLWRWIPTPVTTAEEMHAYVATQGRGVSLPFAIAEQGRNLVIGSTRYANIVPSDRRLEIGWTWLTSRVTGA